MDKRRIYSKTAKGMSEVKNGCKGLAREHARVLAMIDGSSSVGDFLASGALSAEHLVAALDGLARLGMIRVFSKTAKLTNLVEWSASKDDTDDGFSDVLPLLEVKEFTPQESVQAWAQARRGASELQHNGFYSYGNKSALTAGDGDLGPTALVIEDDEEIAELLDMLLSEKGFKVHVAGDMHSALAAIQNGNAPDLVLLDIVLPGMPGKDGFDLLGFIRRERAWTSARVIMVTSQVSDDQVMKGLKADADAYIFKPFKFETLFSCIKSVVGI
jgi:CheY-like chemotaxis protein